MGVPPQNSPQNPPFGGVPPTPKFGSPGTPESPKFGVGGSPPRIRGFGGVPPQIPEFPGFSCFRLNQRSAPWLPNSPLFGGAPPKFPVGRVFQPRGSAALSTMCRDILHLRIKMRRVSEKSFRLQTCVPHSPSEGQGLPIQGWFASRLNISNPRSNSKNDGKKLLCVRWLAWAFCAFLCDVADHPCIGSLWTSGPPLSYSYLF